MPRDDNHGGAEPDRFGSGGEIGEQVEVRLNYPVDGSKRIKGVLVGLEDGEVVVRAGEDEYLLPLENVQRARVVPRFD